MKVSIVTISYNQAQFIERCIQSIIQQSYQNIEYIVVDPGSTDGSQEIINRYSKHITEYIFEPDVGPADGLNKGFTAANGDLFAFLNSDDMLHPNAISSLVNTFKMMNVDVVSGHGYKIDVNGNIIGKIYSNRFDPESYVFDACVLVQQSTAFTAEVFHKVGGFNIQNHKNWDGELWFEMALSGARFKRINKYLSYFRTHSKSITFTNRFRQDGENTKVRLARRIGISETELSNPMKRQWFWLKTRIMDPIILSMRIREKFFDSPR